MRPYALVTGSSDRIGKGIALELARRGYHLVLHYNSSLEKVQLVQQEAEAMGVQALPLQINFSEEHNYFQTFQQLKDQGIQIEILVNSASDFRPSGFEDKGIDMLHRQMKINFEAPYQLTKAFAEVFKKGQIINLLDTKVEKNHTKHLDYLLSKKLLKEFTNLSAVHLSPHIQVNAIAPGLVLPPHDKDESYLHNLSKDIPMQTIGNLGEILKAFNYILDSKFITGQILYIDGGDHLI